MTTTKHLSTLALILSSGVPIASTAVMADSAVFVSVDLIHGLPDTGDYLIGLSSTNHLVALRTADDGTTLTTLGLASSVNDNKLIFGLAELQSGNGGLYFELVPKGGALMLGKEALGIDPRLVATLLMKDNSGEYLGKLMMVIEGDELLFGPETNVDTGTLVDVTILTLAKQTFLVAQSEAKDIILATEAKKHDKTTWVAWGNIGHFSDNGDIVDISTTGLSRIGILAVPTRVAA